MRLWVVGVLGRPEWEFVGVFSSQELAEAACVDENHFVGPCTLDIGCPAGESIDWPGCYFPNDTPAPPDPEPAYSEPQMLKKPTVFN